MFNISFRQLSVLTLVGLALIAVPACGGGGGGGGGGGSKLAGSWLGTLEDPSGDLLEVSISVSSSNQITRVIIDSVDQGRTGTISKVEGQFYAVTLSDGTEGGFYVDTSNTHAFFVDEDFSVAIVQKGASSLPAGGFAEGDVFGEDYSGISATIDNNFELDSTVITSVNVDATGFITGYHTLDDGTEAPFSTHTGHELVLEDATMGRWGGMVMASGTLSSVKIFASPDKSAFGAYAAEDGGVFPEDCVFSIMTRD